MFHIISDAGRKKAHQSSFSRQSNVTERGKYNIGPNKQILFAYNFSYFLTH